MNFTTCPKCNNTILHYDLGYVGNVRFCKICGYHACTYKVRNKINLDKDLGRYKFIYIDVPWGHVTLVSKDGFVTETSVDSRVASNFIDWLHKNSSSYKSAHLSCVKDNKTISINLLDLL